MVYMVLAWRAGFVMFLVRKGRYEESEKILLTVPVFLVLLRFLSGEGEFFSPLFITGMRFPMEMMLFLFLTLISCMQDWADWFPETEGTDSVGSGSCILLVTPLGRQ